jgi:AFG3 family protein
MALADRAAEEVFFGRVTTGAPDDLRRVTQLVYSTIQVYGMNEKVGQLAFPQQEGGSPADKPYSDSTAEAMDDEARAIVDFAYTRVQFLSFASTRMMSIESPSYCWKKRPLRTMT